jgi:hypothetical protein
MDAYAGSEEWPYDSVGPADEQRSNGSLDLLSMSALVSF